MDRESLGKRLPGRFVVVGVGNVLKGDDGVGPAVARALGERFPDRVFDAGSAPENYLGPLRRAEADLVLLVDAADFGGRPGDVRLLGQDDVDGAGIATHAAPLGMVMRALSEELGVETLLLAVQAGHTRLDEPMSDEVTAACERIISELVEALEEGSTAMEAQP